MNIDALKQQRFAFLHKFWELTGGNQNKLIRIGEVAKPLNLNEESAKVIVQYLHGEDLVDATTHGFAVPTYFDVGLYIKHKGIKETEQALSKPDLETEHFPAKVVNYINIGSMNNSNISQGSTNSNQSITITESNKQDIVEIIKALKEILNQPSLQSQQKQELSSEIQTLESQINSPKPKTKIITESLSSARSILEQASGIAMAATPIIAQIGTLLAGIR